MEAKKIVCQEKDSAELLVLRAKRLADRRADEGVVHDSDPILVFRLGAERFACRLGAVSQVVPSGKWTKVPGADPKMLGITAIKGEVHCIFDFARVLELPTSSVNPASFGNAAGHVLVLRMNGYRVGLHVDEINSIDAIPKMDAAAKIAGDPHRNFVRPRDSEPLILVDHFETLLSHLLQGETPA